MVGMVVTISPSLSLYKIVVLPAASRPTIKHKNKVWLSKCNSKQASLEDWQICGPQIPARIGIYKIFFLVEEE